MTAASESGRVVETGPLTDRVLALLAKHDGWTGTLAHIERTESLLAEAERKLSEAEIEVEQWKESAIKIERQADALQAQVDAVRGLANAIINSPTAGYAPDYVRIAKRFRAALGEA